MPLEDFEIKQSLGKGSFGSVCKCIRKSDDQCYAMKQIKITKLKEKDKKNALNQIRFLASLHSPFVVEYKQAFYDQKSQTLCIVMEYANEGDVQGKIKRAINTKERIQEEEIWKLAYNVLEGLNKLHECNIIHRDIKPANIFYHNGVGKIGDLNVAKHLVDQFTVTQTGTPYYASPQVWSEQPYNFKSDIWSLGCVLYEMAMLRPPFRAQTPDKLYKKIMIGQYDKISTPYTKQLSNFVAKLMTHNQKKRPDIKELLSHSKLLDLKSNFESNEPIDERLLKTIKFPPNLKLLNQQLPQAKYQNRCKTSKAINHVEDSKFQKNSSAKLPIPSLKMIVSEKNLPMNIESRQKGPGLKQLLLARRPKALNKCGSQKLIF